MRLRPLLVTVHLWLSFAVGLVFATAAGTGAILTFQHEIDAYLNRDAGYAVTPGDVGFERVAERVRAAHPEHRLELLWFPRWDKPYYEAMLVGPGGADTTQVVDPGTGALLAPVPAASRFTEVVVELHTSLLGGETGRWVVVGTTIASLVILLTGAVLWWPGLRRLASGFTVRPRRTAYILQFDLHRVSGIVALPFLLVMCVTGIFMVFPEFANRVVHAAWLRGPSDLQAWNEVRSAPAPAGWSEAQRPSHAELLRRAHREVPGARTFYVTFPAEPDEPVHVRLQTGIEPRPFGITSRLAFDQYTGELIQVIDPRRMSTPDAITQHWNDRLHFGDFAGAASKLVYLLACLVGAGLVVTGFVMWWLKRRSRNLGRERRVGRRGPADRPARAPRVSA